MNIQEYLKNINKRFITGISREHSYRGDLQTLIESLASGVLITNEPARIECGAPDFIITRKDIPVGYIEAKDIGKDLSGKDFKEQYDRYRKSLNNLIFTDYLDFHLYIDGKFVSSRKIAKIERGKIQPLPENFAQFTTLIKDFCTHVGQTITNAKKLAEMMAAKAKILAQVIEEALISDEETSANSTLKDQMKAFQDVLIHDITVKEFSDVYAQTIAYGMFAARLHDPVLETFTRQEAAELIPKSNPFLRKLFQHIAGYDLDDRIKWIVDALADIFRATDVKALLENFGKATQANDPIIHFYEDFLKEYDPKLRKLRGVYYTPEPVVNFIVRAVDDILKTEFNLPQGLADTSKTKIMLNTQTRDNRSASGYKQIEREVHKVQILDPATGTGTFLSEVVKQIYKKFEGQEGIWSKYVEDELIPRLNGFELLMASYSMAHLKLDLLLSETGYAPTREQRLRIYLTNSLEEHHPDTGTLFAGWLSREANEANHIKRDTPVMCVIGNPPYAVSSSNKSEWIQKLLTDYKKDLNERKINLDDDYIKFIRFGQYFIDKNGEGILAYISNNSFIDGITHRQMRKSLLESFDKIYILDLHGNSLKKEVCPDGSKDKNVFDIKQGVSISICIKTNHKKDNELGQVKHIDLYGEREFKYNILWRNSLKSLDWTIINFDNPYYFFVPKDFSESSSYKEGFLVSELFNTFNTGIQTKRDKVVINFDRDEANSVIEYFKSKGVEEIRQNFNLPSDGRDWTIIDAKNDLQTSSIVIADILYRPFDFRKIIYTGKTKGIVAYPRHNTSRHVLKNKNCSLITLRINGENEEFVCLLTKYLVEKGSLPKGNYSFFPLYLYPETGEQQNFLENAERTPNLNAKIIDEIAAKLGLRFVNEKEETTPSLRATPPLEGGELGVGNSLFYLESEFRNDSENSKLATDNDSENSKPETDNDSENSKPETDNDSENSKRKIDLENSKFETDLEDLRHKTKSSPPSKGGEARSAGVVETFAPIDVLDYIYAVLHSPAYREKYKEFLKIDFPRVPFPKNAETFWQLVALGGELRQIHLLESPKTEQFITTFPKGGDHRVTRKMTKNSIGFELTDTSTTPAPSYKGGEQNVVGRVWINDEQYFDKVPHAAWEFYIGGYQPAQKWLKDRYDRELSVEDIRHYQKIIVALSETKRLMEEIDNIELE